MSEEKAEFDVRTALEGTADGAQLLRLADALVNAHKVDGDHELRHKEIRERLSSLHYSLYAGERAGLLKTPLGWVGLIWAGQGLRHLILPRQSREETLATLQQRGAERMEDPPEQLAEPLQRYFAGDPSHPQLPVDLAAQPGFRRKVLQLVSTIPYGETRSYRWIAEQVGTRSCRAVGQAVGANPLPIVIPCHRVIASNGALRGYAGGLDLKRQLLALERAEPATGR